MQTVGIAINADFVLGFLAIWLICNFAKMTKGNL
jgi:hypothetical protein